MNINSISSIAGTTQSTEYEAKAKKDTSAATDTADKKDTAVVYEKNKDYKTDNAKLIAKLKADSEKHIADMQSLVEKMFLKQGKKFSNVDDMIKSLANGELKVDPETAKQAQEDISTDGYWGVDKTSDRIFDFAKALSGGDSEKMDQMLDAFKKGFKDATKSWGKDLPDISQQTYDSVLKKFEDYKNAEKTAEE